MACHARTFLELVKSRQPQKTISDDKYCPSITDEGHCSRNRARIIRKFRPLHVHQNGAEWLTSSELELFRRRIC